MRESGKHPDGLKPRAMVKNADFTEAALSVSWGAEHFYGPLLPAAALS